MAYNDISKNFTYENGGTIDGDLALTTMAANTKIKNKASGELYTKRSGFSNVFDKSNTLADYLKADEFGINTSGSGNGVASITYSSSGKKITQNLTTFTTPSDLATANDNLKSQAVGSITVSGRTVTYKNVNGQTLGSFQTQDNNTTYSAGTGLSLSGTTFNVTSTAGNSNLQWNTEITLGTVGGLAIKAKLPANPNTNISYSAGTGLSLSGTTFSLSQDVLNKLNNIDNYSSEWATLYSNTGLTVGRNYSGSDLYDDNGNAKSGTWKCMFINVNSEYHSGNQNTRRYMGQFMRVG